MIGKGIFKIDDYIRFGEMIDCMVENGAVNFILVPKKNMLVVACRLRDKDKVIKCAEDFSIDGITVRGGMSWIKIKLG